MIILVIKYIHRPRRFSGRLRQASNVWLKCVAAIDVDNTVAVGVAAFPETVGGKERLVFFWL
jgi:hypothetical protein